MKAVRVIAMGVAGIVVAVILSLGAFAIAGGSIDEPARPVSIPSGRETPRSSEAPRPESPTSSPEPSDDHGGASQEPSEPTTNDHDEDD